MNKNEIKKQIKTNKTTVYKYTLYAKYTENAQHNYIFGLLLLLLEL